MLTRIDKAIVAGVTAAAAAGLTAQQSGQGTTSIAAVALGTFLVIGFLTWLTPNKAA